MRRILAIAILASFGGLAACAALIGLEQGQPREDAGVMEASDGPVEMYHDIADPNRWSTFDLQSLLGTMSASMVGGTYDGRWVYFAPAGGSTMLRYDTNANFGTNASWEKFDIAALDMNAKSYYGTALPNANRVVFAPFPTSLVASYDTQKNFDAGFSLVGSGTAGFVGAVTDGKSVYFVPHWNPATMMYAGKAMRWQLEAGAPDASPFATYDFQVAISPSAIGYYGGVYDGRYVYYAPYASSIAIRHDTTLAFTDNMAWKTFDTKTIRADAINYTTAAFDGKFVYLVPRGGGNGPHGIVVRVDTTLPFDKATSWSSFDTTQINPIAKGFGGSAFDGRFLYFTPTQNGLVVRYDTERPFGAASSWSSFDVATKASTAKSYHGAVFDGRYIYLVPTATTLVARFEARSPALYPLPYSGGSFF